MNANKIYGRYYFLKKTNGEKGCSAFRVTGNILMTSGHCMNGKEMILDIKTGEEHQINTIGYIAGDEIVKRVKNKMIFRKGKFKVIWAKDIALVEAPSLKGNWEDLEEVFSDYKLFEDVYVPMPVILEEFMIALMKTTIAFSNPDSELLIISNPVVPGTSGSPIFNKDAKVVGMIVAGLKPAGLGVGIGAHILYDFCRKILY